MNNKERHEQALEQDRQYEEFLRENVMRGSGWLAERLGFAVWQVQKMLKRLGIEGRHKTGPASPERNVHWGGGRTVEKAGYVLLHHPDHPMSNSGGYVREHRLVMEESLGRLLSRQEVVHHLNGNRGDNRLVNLRLYSHNGPHMAHEWEGRTHSPETREKMRQSALARERRRRDASPPATHPSPAPDA